VSDVHDPETNIWTRLFRQGMFAARAVKDVEKNAWVINCIDHNGTTIGEEELPLTLTAAEALDKAEQLCP